MSRRLFAVVAGLVSMGLALSVTVGTTAVAGVGKALLLGQDNRAPATTTLSSKGGGPALRLKSRGRAPALAVSNSRLVKRLNADRLDGRDAEDLAPVTTRFVVARPGDSLRPYKVLRVNLPAGSYLMTGTGALTTDEPSLSWHCFVGTLDFVTSIGTTGLLALESGLGSGGWSLSDVVTVTTEPLVVGCIVEEEHELLVPVSFTFRRVADVVTGQGQPVDLPSPK